MRSWLSLIVCSHYFLPSLFISNLRLEVILAGPWCHNPTQPSHLKKKTTKTKNPPHQLPPTTCTSRLLFVSSTRSQFPVLRNGRDQGLKTLTLQWHLGEVTGDRLRFGGDPIVSWLKTPRKLTWSPKQELFQYIFQPVGFQGSMLVFRGVG